MLYLLLNGSILSSELRNKVNRSKSQRNVYVYFERTSEISLFYVIINVVSVQCRRLLCCRIVWFHCITSPVNR